MLDNLIKKLQTHSGIECKKDIQSAAKTFSHSPFSELGKSAMLGDDAAAVSYTHLTLPTTLVV